MHFGLRGVRGLGVSVLISFTIFAYLYYHVTLVHVEENSHQKEKTQPEVSDAKIRNGSRSASQAVNPAKETNHVSPSEVVLLLKTGSNTLWRRVPLHLLTTFADGQVPNYVLYSDVDERLSSGVHAIDVLANVTDVIRQHSPLAYEIYQKQQAVNPSNNYYEQAGLPADAVSSKVGSDGNPDGWVLDRFKFLPMLTHAWEHWPHMKYYVYIEDDTYIFWPNLLRYLRTLSPTEFAYFGAFSGEGNATFAQGGSGIIFTHGLMETVFGSDSPPTLEQYGNFTSRACCGDTVLGKILRDYGIQVNRGTWGTLSFRPEPPWRTGFDERDWCLPIFTFHHVHQRDIAMLDALERKLLAAGKEEILFRDIYMETIAPFLVKDEINNWDNFAAQWISTPNQPFAQGWPFATGLDDLNSTAAYQSKQGCRDACLALESCLSWRFAEESCALDSAVIWGRAAYYDTPEETLVSGWVRDRIERTLLSLACDGATPN